MKQAEGDGGLLKGQQASEIQENMGGGEENQFNNFLVGPRNPNGPIIPSLMSFCLIRVIASPPTGCHHNKAPPALQHRGATMNQEVKLGFGLF